MPVTASRLPRRLGAVGIVVTVALAGMWWFIGAFNLLAERQVSPNHWEPSRFLWFVEDMTFALCPPELPLGFAAMDMSARGQLVAWCVAAALNGVLYYWLGRGIVALRKRFRQ